MAIALQLGATFVARSFSGDKAQLVPLIKAAIQHQGAAFIDVISPCIAFNNHAGSTKSFDYVREHNEAVNALDIMIGRAAITVDYEPGKVVTVQQHDGTSLRLRKLNNDYDPTRPPGGAELPAAPCGEGRSGDRACSISSRTPTTCMRASTRSSSRSTSSRRRSFARARARWKSSTRACGKAWRPIVMPQAAPVAAGGSSLDTDPARVTRLRPLPAIHARPRYAALVRAEAAAAPS